MIGYQCLHKEPWDQQKSIDGSQNPFFGMIVKGQTLQVT